MTNNPILNCTRPNHSTQLSMSQMWRALALRIVNYMKNYEEQIAQVKKERDMLRLQLNAIQNIDDGNVGIALCYEGNDEKRGYPCDTWGAWDRGTFIRSKGGTTDMIWCDVV